MSGSGNSTAAGAPKRPRRSSSLERELEDLQRATDKVRRDAADAQRATEEAAQHAIAEAQRDAAEAQRATAEAQRAAAEAQRAAAEARREAAEARRDAAALLRRMRLQTLAGINATGIPDIITENSRRSTRSLVDGITVEAGDTLVDRMLPPVASASGAVVEDRICEELQGLLQISASALPTPPLAFEVEFWQRYMSQLLDSLQRIARRSGAPVLKAHHDKQSSAAARKRPDFAFTLPYEHHVHHSSTCFVVEMKPHARVGQARASLMREAVAQCIASLASRQLMCDDEPQVGYALATAGAGLCIVHVDFSQPSAPVRISRELAFLPPSTFIQHAAAAGPDVGASAASASPVATAVDDVHVWGAHFATRLVVAPALAPAGSGAVARSSDGSSAAAAAAISPPRPHPAMATPLLPGLRALVRLSLTHDVGAFGLARVLASPREGSGFAGGRLLGEGGYANVAEWRVSATGELVAAKYLRCRAEPSQVDSLAQEAGVLVTLQAAGVPRVPQLVVPAPHLIFAEDGRNVLLLRPVGESLRQLVGDLAEDDASGARARAAASLGAQLWETLTLARAAGVQHGDVRPGNVVYVAGSRGSCGGDGDGDGIAAAAAAGDIGAHLGPLEDAVDWASGAWVLIDWGLAERVGAPSRPASKMRGEMAFMSDRRLRILAGDDAASRTAWAPLPQDDLDAAMFTFMAVAGSSDCGASLPRGALVAPVHVLEERWDWAVERRVAIERAANLLAPPGGGGGGGAAELRAAVGAYLAQRPCALAAAPGGSTSGGAGFGPSAV